MKSMLDAIASGWVLGGLDLKIRYRRSILGPIWISISYLVTVCFLSIVWTKVFNQNIKNFIWYFSIGLLVWNYIVNVISSSYMLFTDTAGILLNYNIDKDVIITRNIVRELYVFIHALVVLILIFFYAEPNIHSKDIVLSFLGFVLVTVILFNLSYLISILVLRYRDLKEVFATSINLLYYVTPILWPIESLKGSEYIYLYNPFYHIVNVIRAPLMNAGEFWLESFVICFLIMVFVYFVRRYVKSKYDHYVALWI
jgi:ABC-type polysaccharide/polyol phosphate export permease